MGRGRHLGLWPDRLGSMAHFTMVFVVPISVHAAPWSELRLLQSMLARANRLVHRCDHRPFLVVLHGTAMETIHGPGGWAITRAVDHVT